MGFNSGFKGVNAYSLHLFDVYCERLNNPLQTEESEYLKDIRRVDEKDRKLEK